MLAGCQGHPQHGASEDNGKFYSYIDASGQLITIEQPATAREQPSPRPDVRQTPTPRSPVSPPASATSPEPSETLAPEEGPVASDPGGLWEMSDEFYLSDEDIQRKLEARERDRFVTVHDESGHLVTRRVDMIEAREAAEARAGQKEYQEFDAAPGIEQGEMAVRADCCADELVDAPLLEVGAEHLLDFAASRQQVGISGRHPAVTMRLAPEVAALRVRSWLSGGGYVHPQIVLLDASGLPISLIQSAFSRRYPETWRAHASLEGDVPVPEEAYAAVFFLIYAHVKDNDIELVQGAPWQEDGHDLRLGGEVSVRALRR